MKTDAAAAHRSRHHPDAPPDAAFDALYERLRRLAQSMLGRERPGHTLQATALVHEAFLKLPDDESAWRDDARALAVAARAMREVLVDHARARNALKRGGDRARLTLASGDGEIADGALDALDLDDALRRLAELDQRRAGVVEMRFFAGMTYAQIGEALDVSPRTAEADWYLARAWLRRELDGADA